MKLTLLLINMNKNYDFIVKLKASNTGSAVLVKQNDYYYLLTAAHQIVLPVDEEVFGHLLHIVQGKIPGVDAAGVEHAYPGQL